MSAAGEKILSSIREARAVLRGEAEGHLVVHAPEAVDVKAIRRRLGMSQAQFAAAFGLELDAIRNWGQGRRRPQGC